MANACFVNFIKNIARKTTLNADDEMISAKLLIFVTAGSDLLVVSVNLLFWRVMLRDFVNQMGLNQCRNAVYTVMITGQIRALQVYV